MSELRETNRRYIKTNNQEISTKRAFDSTLLKYNCKRFDGKLKEIRFTRTESVRVSVPVTEQGIKHPSFKRVKSIKTIETAIESYVNTTEYDNNNASPQHYAEDFVILGSKSTGMIAVTSARRSGSRLVTKPISKKSETIDKDRISGRNLQKTANHYRPVNVEGADSIKHKTISIKQRETRSIHARTMKPAPEQTNRQNTINPNQPHNITSETFNKEHTAIGEHIRTSKKVENCRTFVNTKPGNYAIRTRKTFAKNPAATMVNSRPLTSVGIRKKSKFVENGRTTAVDRVAHKHSVPTNTIHKSFRKQHRAFVNRYKISRILTFRKPARLGLRRKLKDLAKRKQTTGLLMKALASGGGLVAAVVLICVLLGGAFFLYGDTGTTSYQDVNEKVQAYQALIEENCEKYEMPEFVDLVKAVMMQESGGEGMDPMQASECGYNEKYPREPGGIKDPAYSVACGVQYLKSCLDAAEVNGPLDMDHIKLALQGYNYGKGYITWAVDTYGGYSKANAVEYGELMAKKNGWKSYGDADYVEHVLRYYPYGNYSYDIENTGPGRLGLPIKGMGLENITSHFGPRISPGGIGSTEHDGIDIGFPEGTHVLACESGEVTFAGWNGGYGKCIEISHIGDLKVDGATVETIYAHLSEIKVRVGQKVVRGQYIGEVGNTGNSTGPHLHLGVLVDGEFVNPERGWVRLE